MRRDYKNIVLSAFSSTMSVHRDYRRYLPHCVFLTLLVASCTAREICDKTKCSGPLYYYHSLNCTPVYKNPNDCCPEEFNCRHLVSLSKDKCYVNGHEYNVGEKLRDKDANPCDTNCMCTRGYEGQAASFICEGVNCEVFAACSENCFTRESHDSCCLKQPVCMEENETRATCEVDGTIYKDGEEFRARSNPDFHCICLPGYKGENIEPFCKKPNRRFCDPLFQRANDIHNKCAPFFNNNQNPQTDCSYASRCQSGNDSVIHNHDAKSVSDTDQNTMCVFGNMTMHIGDTLTEGEDYNSFCVKCTCEVPPFPTCVEKTNCDYSKLFTIYASS